MLEEQRRDLRRFSILPVFLQVMMCSPIVELFVLCETSCQCWSLPAWGLMYPLISSELQMCRKHSPNYSSRESCLTKSPGFEKQKVLFWPHLLQEETGRVLPPGARTEGLFNRGSCIQMPDKVGPARKDAGKHTGKLPVYCQRL